MQHTYKEMCAITAYKYIYYYDQHITCTQATICIPLVLWKTMKFHISASKLISGSIFKPVHFKVLYRCIVQMFSKMVNYWWFPKCTLQISTVSCDINCNMKCLSCGSLNVSQNLLKIMIYYFQIVCNLWKCFHWKYKPTNNYISPVIESQITLMISIHISMV